MYTCTSFPSSLMCKIYTSHPIDSKHALVRYFALHRFEFCLAPPSSLLYNSFH